MLRTMRLSLPFLAGTLAAPLVAAPVFVPGEFVRVTKSEMVAFEGKNLARALKGQEFRTWIAKI